MSFPLWERKLGQNLQTHFPAQETGPSKQNELEPISISSKYAGWTAVRGNQAVSDAGQGRWKLGGQWGRSFPTTLDQLKPFNTNSLRLWTVFLLVYCLVKTFGHSYCQRVFSLGFTERPSGSWQLQRPSLPAGGHGRSEAFGGRGSKHSYKLFNPLRKGRLADVMSKSHIADTSVVTHHNLRLQTVKDVPRNEKSPSCTPFACSAFQKSCVKTPVLAERLSTEG